MNANRPGKLVVISGPSGAGKTSICDELLKRIPNSRWSVSVTTRPMRGHEVDGEAYRFITREEFDRMVARDELLEHEIEVQGGAQVAQRVPDSIRIFILPPTMETLKARLEGRQTETEALQDKRLAEADGEIGFAKNSGYYQYFITNDILKDSVDRVLEIIEQETKTA